MKFKIHHTTLTAGELIFCHRTEEVKKMYDDLWKGEMSKEIRTPKIELEIKLHEEYINYLKKLNKDPYVSESPTQLIKRTDCDNLDENGICQGHIIEEDIGTCQDIIKVLPAEYHDKIICCGGCHVSQEDVYGGMLVEFKGLKYSVCCGVIDYFKQLKIINHTFKNLYTTGYPV